MTVVHELMHRPRRLVLLSSLVLLTACAQTKDPAADGVTVSDSAGVPVYRSEKLPAWNAPEFRWRLELQRAIPTGSGDASESPLIYQPQAYTRLEDGTLIVLDGWDQRLAVVSPSAPIVLRRFAPSGRGPGEILSSNSALWPAADGSFLVLDPGNRRLSRFDTAGALLEERAVDLPGSGGITIQDPVRHLPYFWKVFRDEDDTRVLMDSVGRLDPSTATVSYVTALPPRVPSRSMSTSRQVLFAPRAWFAPLGAGGVVVARNDRARFQHYADDGRLVGIIEAPAEVTPVPLSDRPGIYEELLGVAVTPTTQRPEIATHYPLWDIMWPLDDSLFALQQNHRSAVAGEPPIPEGRIVWRVFSVGGGYRGAILFPDGFAQPYWIQRNHLVGTRRDGLGVATIELYALYPPSA